MIENNKLPIVFVGSDCPSIPLDLVATAIKKACSGVAYLVPSKDGGYVLLALPQMTPLCVFDGVTWSAASTAVSQLHSLMACGIRAEVGPELSDIDTPQDIELLLADGTPQNELQNTRTYRACSEAQKSVAERVRKRGSKKKTAVPPCYFQWDLALLWGL